jgi:broad specificity phosphatase PhoE
MDVGLNERGHQQAVEAAKHIPADTVFDIATSPLRRARQTAEIIRGNIDCAEFRIMEEFKELDQGFWNGLRGAEIIDHLDPDRYSRWQKNPLEHYPPRGDSLPEVRDRVKKGIDYLLNEVSERPQIIVGHKVVNSMIAHLAGDWPFEKVMDSLPDNAAIYSVNIKEV